MTFLDQEHGQILRHAMDLIESIKDIESRFEPGEVSHHQHHVFADRARSLAFYLDAAIGAVRDNLYAPAFSLLRSALEHHVVDLLVFLARKYVLVVKNVDQSTWAQWQRDRASQVEWTKTVASWSRSRKGTVKIVRTGLHTQNGSVGPRSPRLSVYYFLLDNYDPFAGRPSLQAHLSRGFFGPEVHLKHAHKAKDLYEGAMSWSALKDNLLANRIFLKRDLIRLEVHYSFLSAFVHPTKRGAQLAYGRANQDRNPRYDHYSSELALLYANVIAAAELKAIGRMSNRHPRVRIRDWPDLEGLAASAEALCEYLWFPPTGRPHLYDRTEEANHRSAGRGIPTTSRRRVRPDQLSERSIRYYRNPLERLIRMHSSWVELTTGYAYQSPWEREDARHRA